MYAMNLKLIPLIICLGLVLSTALAYFLPRRMQQVLFGVFGMAGFFAVFHYTIMGRVHTENHSFILFNSYSNEFWREMIMNGLLYFPLGLAIPFVIRSYSISVLIGFVLSVLIEAWQYIAGAGLAQGSDVILNTLGVAVGGLSFVWYGKLSGTKSNSI